MKTPKRIYGLIALKDGTTLGCDGQDIHWERQDGTVTDECHPKDLKRLLAARRCTITGIDDPRPSHGIGDEANLYIQWEDGTADTALSAEEATALLT
jgi:hypothetical protein